MPRSERPRIFLSFPSGANPFVAAWLDNREAFRHGWDPDLFSYRTDPARVGSHEEYTSAKIREADVFVAVLRSDYLVSPACLTELNSAVAETVRRTERPLTPVFLMIEDNPALRKWWKDETASPGGTLSALPQHTVYHEAWDVAQANPASFPAAEHMQRLAAQTRVLIDKLDAESAAQGVVPPVDGALVAVLLGAAQRELADEAKAALQTLEESLRSVAPERTVLLPDYWDTAKQRPDSQRRLAPFAAAHPIFVQACDGDLADENLLPEGTALLRQRLRRVLPETAVSANGGPPLILWLPNTVANPAFAERANGATETEPKASPCRFRAADPAQLAGALMKQLGIAAGALELLICYPGTSPIDKLLEREFKNVLGSVPVATLMWGRPTGLLTMLKDRRSKKTKLVVATHDLAGSAFDEEQAEQRLFQDAREIAAILKEWREGGTIEPADCIAALVRQRTRSRDRGSVAALLNEERFCYIRVDGNQVDRNDVCLVLNDLGLKAPGCALT